LSLSSSLAANSLRVQNRPDIVAITRKKTISEGYLVLSPIGR
jgi:hypothetical protein